jgi:3-phenylpropionate/cinnamic acid dioxygenase small subunit
VEKDHGDAMNAATGQRIDLQAAVEFIWREADLLDTPDYSQWLQLWTSEGRYIIPIEREAADYAAVLNVVYDDGTMRAARIKRLGSGLSMSASSAARTVRTLSRFVIVTAGANEIDVRCAQHLVEQKRDRTRLIAADVSYRLVNRNGELALDRKIVHLIDSDEALHGIGYIL